MNYKEIVEKLKEIYPVVRDFAYEEQPYDFENYPEALEAQRVRKEFRTLHIVNGNWDSKESLEIYSKLPDEYEIIRRLSRQKNNLNWVEVDQYGGEGQGDSWWSVKYFPDHSEIFTNNLYQKFCDIKGIEFTISQKILYWDGKFEPTKFMEYIGKKGYCYYRYSYKGVPQKPYWTKSGKDMGKEKFNTDELWDDFNNVKL